MKKIVLIATAVGLLVASGAAYAALNTYSATLKFSPKSAGTPAKPVPVSYTQNIKASNTVAGDRTGVLTDITTKIYGLKADGKDFPTCSFNTIQNAKNDNKCPKGALVATGAITATVGAAKDFTAAGTACDPLLHVWNGGQGKLTFFFVDTATHQCLNGALSTGSVGPYPATYKTKGKFLVVDVPVPPYVSFPVKGLAGSLETEHLKWLKVTKKVKGKTVAASASIGCLKGKRPYKTTFKANLPNSTTGNPGPNEVKTVKGSAPC